MKNLIDLDPKEFNGRLGKTIRLIMKNVNNELEKNIPDEETRRLIANSYESFLEQKLYFKQEDLPSAGIPHIIKFIDRVFDPADNEAFVSKYNDIRMLRWTSN